MKLKSIYIIICCSFLLSFKTTLQDATIDETVSWLASKMNFDDVNDYPIARYNLTFDKVKKELKYDIIFLNADRSPRQFVVMQIPVKDINPKSIKILGDSNMGWIQITTNDKKRTIRSSYRWAKDAPNTTIHSNEAEIQFRFPKQQLEENENILERVKKALQYLIKLCGGNGEKF